MNLSISISRLTVYYSRHGFRHTIRRFGLVAKRRLFANRMAVFYCDLAAQSQLCGAFPGSLKVERAQKELDLLEQDFQDIISFWNPKLAQQNIKERFAKGASLWLVKTGGRLAGFGWTLKGSTIEPYFFPLGPDDVHLFDFHIFSEYRGQGINPVLVAHILRNLSVSGIGGRAFIEAAEWNKAQLASLRKTSFCALGLARSFGFLGRRLTLWAPPRGTL